MNSSFYRYLISGDEKKTIAQLRQEAYDLRAHDGIGRYYDEAMNASIDKDVKCASAEKMSEIKKKLDSIDEIAAVCEAKDTVEWMKKANYSSKQILYFVGEVSSNERQCISILKECGYSYEEMIKLAHEAGAQCARIFRFAINAGYNTAADKKFMVDFFRKLGYISQDSRA